MKKDLEFKFRTSISREGYQDKDTAKMCLSSLTAKKVGKVKMAFKEQTVTVDEFLDYAVKGHAFCNLFEFDENKKYWINSTKAHKSLTYPIYTRGANKGYFKLSFKSDEFFKGSQTVFVDIDFTHFASISDYISCLTYQPTCAYYSYSDGLDKKGIVSRRFRLVYIFDSILNATEFRDVTFTLYDSIVRDTEEPMYDSCGCSYSQYMNGGNKQEIYNSSIIYSKDDFPAFELPVEVNYQVEEEKPVESKEITFTDELVVDMTYAPYEHVVRKWWAKGLRYFTQTEVDFGDKYYITTTDDFVRLPYSPNKIEDGNHRRKKLFVRACLRRLMKKDVTPDELLYNLFIDTYKFFDNSNGEIDIDCLQRKVINAYKMDIEEIKEMSKDFYKPSFVISSTVEDKRKAVGEARTDITNQLIGEMYDVNATVKANQIVMQEAGYKVSLSRLYKFCEDFNIETVKPSTRQKKAIVEGYNPNLSVRENMKAMNCTMYQVLKAKEAYNK